MYLFKMFFTRTLHNESADLSPVFNKGQVQKPRDVSFKTCPLFGSSSHPGDEFRDDFKGHLFPPGGGQR